MYIAFSMYLAYGKLSVHEKFHTVWCSMKILITKIDQITVISYIRLYVMNTLESQWSHSLQCPSAYHKKTTIPTNFLQAQLNIIHLWQMKLVFNAEICI